MIESKIYDPKISVALSASAGSGKTHALTTRLITMLFFDIKPYEIITITFTNSAARDIRGKLLDRIERMALGDKEELDFFHKILGWKKKAIVQKAEEIKDEVIKGFSLFQISTIHSFLAKIIRCFPKETSIPLDIMIIDEIEKQALLDESIESFYRDIAESKQLQNRIFNFFTNYKERKLSSRSTFKAIYQKRESNSYMLNDFLNNIDRGIIAIEKEFQSTSNRLKGKELENNINLLLDFCRSHLKTKGKNKNIISFIDKLDRYLLYKNIGLLTEISAFKRDKNNIIRWLFTVLKALDFNESKKFEESFTLIRNSILSYLLAEMEYNVYSILFIFSWIKKSYNQLKNSHRVMDFNDIELFAARFLKGVSDFKYLNYRIDTRIKYVLIDEFQDTSEVQWDAVKRIVNNSLNRGGTVFYVGDVKQSIYRWRGGKPTLFEDVSYSLNIRKERLKYTYRQNYILLNFVNRVFESIVEGIYQNYPYQEQFLPTVESAKDHRGYVLIRQCSDKEKVIEEIIHLIETLQKNGVNTNDIAVLCRKNDEIELIEKALIKVGIHYVSEGKSKLFKDYSVMDMINILKFVLNPGESIYLAALLRSPIFRYSYEELEKLKDESERITLDALKEYDQVSWEKISYIMNHSRYITASGFFRMVYEVFDVLNIYKAKIDPLLELYEFTYRFEDNYEKLSLDEFEKYIDENSETIPLRSGGDGISLMTIHASKGLECHTVIFPFLNQPFKFKMDNSMLFKMDKSGKIQDYIIAKSNYRDYLSVYPYIAHIYDEKDDEYKIDELNALYVALTRAKENLLVIPCSKNRQQTVGDILISSLDKSYKKGEESFFKEEGAIVSSSHIKTKIEKAFTPARIITEEIVTPYYKSEKDIGYRDVRSNRIGRLKGLIFHGAIENIKKIPVTNDDLKAFLSHALVIEGIDFTRDEREEALRLAYNSLLNTINDSRLNRFFSKMSKSEVDTFSTEYPLLLGRIDRIYIGERVEIVDFKTNLIRDKSHLNELVKYYSGQVESYCKSISEIYSDRSVNGYLYFTDAPLEDRIVSVI